MDVDRPLARVCVLVLRASGQASELSGRIRALGGEPVEAPVVVVGPGDDDALEAAVRALAAGGFVAVAFTSPNGVEAAVRALAAAGVAPDEALGAVRVAAVGPGTARAVRERLGVDPDTVPERSTTASLAAAFPPGSGRVLLPRADIASAALPDGLRARGYEPVEVDAYVTARPAGLPGGVADALAAGTIDVIAFTSPSTVRNLCDLLGGPRWRAGVVSIGPVTSATCRELGIAVDVEAERHDLDGLVAAIVAYWAAGRR